MKKWLNVFLAIVIILAVAAGCGTSNDEDQTTGGEDTQQGQEDQGGNDQTNDEEEGEGEETNGTDDGNSGTTDEALPEEKELKVYGEMEETKTAKLHESELGYSIYILDKYTFSAEEPNKDVILSDIDGEFFLRIEPIPADADVADLKDNAVMALKSTYSEDAIHDRDPAELHDEFFRDAEFYVTGSDTNGSVSYMVKEIDGQLFRFTFHFPNKEAAEGVTPGFWAMARSIVVQ